MIGRHVILVVEDEIIIRMDTAEQLREMGFEVVEASHAAEALQVFQSHIPVSLLFTDVQMPGAMNGLSLANWTLQNRPGVVVSITSGSEEMLAKARAIRDKQLVFSKPYDAKVIGRFFLNLLGPPPHSLRSGNAG
ncbi:response regulator [Mesorhizobium sp. M7A.F.Ca.US.011.01.1.1]|uniref:response regulator n=1 Tax=unclassified Mesorhizobium TaxID=325217 RepID=UPI000FCC1D56|nr:MULTISPECIES: response regulator [unclassified Mesorhizobium]RUW89862.1 response regulator [Mesorhizobium sp. M7A.F.Ca.US.010.02.1.1]RUX28840.1 response regulator [Mesorhizobium sp. M7A.F.Ca.US.011.01.1.1]